MWYPYDLHLVTTYEEECNLRRTGIPMYRNACLCCWSQPHELPVEGLSWRSSNLGRKVDRANKASNVLHEKGSRDSAVHTSGVHVLATFATNDDFIQDMCTIFCMNCIRIRYRNICYSSESGRMDETYSLATMLQPCRRSPSTSVLVVA